MASTLLLRLAGPLQSWGDSSRFNDRGTRREPTKSGVIGMVAAASGRRRIDPIEDLAALRFGTRVDQAGGLERDFHTAIDWRVGPKKGSKPLSHRYYLTDACFLVGLEGPVGLLNGVAEALRRPHFQIYLGRRSCPPSGPVVLGIHDADLTTTLEKHPWLASEWYRKACSDPAHLPLTVDVEPGEHEDELVPDQPVSFNPTARTHQLRPVAHKFVTMPNPQGRPSRGHDPLSLL